MTCADAHDCSYGGDLTERAVANHDIFPTLIPAGADAVFTNTALLWYGFNEVCILLILHFDSD